MERMKTLVLTRPMGLFLGWSVPGFLACLWYVFDRPEEMAAGYFLWTVWTVLGVWAINGWAGLLLRGTHRVLDETCDPRPMLELCRAVIRQNPGVVSYRVMEAWALSLLGREEEARVSARLVAGRWKLRRRAGLVLIWCSVLPAEDPGRRAELARLERRARFRPRLRRLLGEVRSWEAETRALEEAPAELEPLLLGRLERAGCTREQVAARLALGVYCCRRGELERAREHLGFVTAHGGELAVRREAERLLEGLPRR